MKYGYKALKPVLTGLNINPVYLIRIFRCLEFRQKEGGVYSKESDHLKLSQAVYFMTLRKHIFHRLTLI